MSMNTNSAARTTGKEVEQACSDSKLYHWGAFRMERTGMIRADISSDRFVIRPEDCRNPLHAATIHRLYSDEAGAITKIPIMLPFDDINAMISLQAPRADAPMKGAFIFCVPKVPGLGVWALCGDTYHSFLSIKSKLQMIQNIARPYCELSGIPNLFHLTKFKEGFGDGEKEQWLVTIDSNYSVDGIEAAIAQKFPRIQVPVMGELAIDQSAQFILPMDDMPKPTAAADLAMCKPEEVKPANTEAAGAASSEKAEKPEPPSSADKAPASKPSEPSRYNKRLVAFMRALRANKSLAHLDDKALLICFMKIAERKYQTKLDSLSEKQVSDMTQYVGGMLKKNNFSEFMAVSSQPAAGSTSASQPPQEGDGEDAEWPNVA